MAQRITLKRVATWITEGRGYGHHENYKPWIKIQTRGSPTQGNLQYRYIPELRRHGHLLSAGELKLARLLLYLGVDDLREQFPCWPWKHPHPLYEHPNFSPAPIPWSDGTLATAVRLAIKHPHYPGTSLYHIPTIDLLATVPMEGNYRAIAFAVKPSPDEIELGEWDATKLAIQENYCHELGIPWHLICPDQIPETLSANLGVLMHYSPSKPNLSRTQDQFAQGLTHCLHLGRTLAEALATVKSTQGISDELGHELFHRALWFKQLPIDLRQAWVFSEPPTLSNGAWIKQTHDLLLGATSGGR